MKSAEGIKILVDQAINSVTQEEEVAQKTIIRFVQFEAWIEQIKPEDINVLQYLYYTFLKEQNEIIFTKEDYDQILQRECFKSYTIQERDFRFAEAIVESDLAKQLEILKKINFKKWLVVVSEEKIRKGDGNIPSP